ncbi:ParM/StbA family protein [Ruminococcus albus]|uniref:Actin-like protein N-terminal domain-containing protein n=1 Tax=Ruminococcus albus (strain ATCC 27210 / DSM 20455 / JCM 14654 / NCDO 2250 / 7) TaxID=697329 RepID=E6UJX8_RUMA7|nr:ParM/StbA family protein [Ruminococcus albus]ADU23974.1 hypothetical protein Rumal_3532 [Ruminococcus albus 7 = DSM 20455]
MINTKDFKTKTYLKKGNNIGSNKAWVIAMDVGYSAVKIMSKTDICSFPSFAIRRKDNTASIGDAAPTDIQYKGEDGVIWDVGEIAVGKISQSDSSNSEEMLYSRNRYTNPMFLVISRVGIALGLQGYMGENGGGKKKIVLQTGLPPAYVKADSKPLKNILKGKHEFYLKIGKETWKKYCFELEEENIWIMQQPLGSLLGATLTDEGKQTPDGKDLMNKNVLIFDGGFGTLDTFEIINRTIGSTQTFDHLGMKAILHKAVNDIYNKYDEEIAVSAMQNILSTGKIKKYDSETVSTKTIEIADIVETCSYDICMEAIKSIRTIYNNLIEYDYLLVTGGTGDAWFSTVKNYFSKMEGLNVIAANRATTIPQIFSNVRGYYLYRVTALNSKKSA